jgi:hypothetical protein
MMISDPVRNYTSHFCNFKYIDGVDTWEWVKQFARHKSAIHPEGKTMSISEAISWCIMQVKTNFEQAGGIKLSAPAPKRGV